MRLTSPPPNRTPAAARPRVAPQPNAQPTRERLVLDALTTLARQGLYGVRAAVPGWRSPMPVTWEWTGAREVPDITGHLDGTPCLVHVFTATDLVDESASRRLTLFSVHADLHMQHLIVFAPLELVDKAEKRLAFLNVRARLITP